MAELMSNGGRRGEARRYPVVLCVALELFLTDAENPLYLRFAAGVMLVRVWATLRFDDTKAITPAATQTLEHMWRYELARTKTTGPGRKRLTVHSYISKYAYFVVPGWHETFMQLSRRGLWPIPRITSCCCPRQDLTTWWKEWPTSAMCSRSSAR